MTTSPGVSRVDPVEVAHIVRVHEHVQVGAPYPFRHRHCDTKRTGSARGPRARRARCAPRSELTRPHSTCAAAFRDVTVMSALGPWLSTKLSEAYGASGEGTTGGFWTISRPLNLELLENQAGRDHRRGRRRVEAVVEERALVRGLEDVPERRGRHAGEPQAADGLFLAVRRHLHDVENHRLPPPPPPAHRPDRRWRARCSRTACPAP